MADISVTLVLDDSQFQGTLKKVTPVLTILKRKARRWAILLIKLVRMLAT